VGHAPQESETPSNRSCRSTALRRNAHLHLRRRCGCRKWRDMARTCHTCAGKAPEGACRCQTENSFSGRRTAEAPNEKASRRLLVPMLCCGRFKPWRPPCVGSRPSLREASKLGARYSRPFSLRIHGIGAIIALREVAFDPNISPTGKRCKGEAKHGHGIRSAQGADHRHR